jgi:hypothetical protein
MEIVPNNLIKDKTGKPECELVEREKQEYKLVGKFRRTRGLSIFAYDFKNDKLYKPDIKLPNAIDMVIVDGKLETEDKGAEEVTINSSHEHFEALNFKSAEIRLQKYKDGKVKELCNLKPYNPEGIKFW